MVAPDSRKAATHEHMGACTLAIANRKGGTGKSTTTVNLAAELGGRGYRVLVADLDPQGHAGLGLGVRSAAAGATHLAFRKDRVDLAGCIQRSNAPGVDVIAADPDFDGAITISSPRCLAAALETAKPHYDVVLIDSPPVAVNILICVLLASDGVLMPISLDYLALEGARLFARTYH